MVFVEDHRIWKAAAIAGRIQPGRETCEVARAVVSCPGGSVACYERLGRSDVSLSVGTDTMAARGLEELAVPIPWQTVAALYPFYRDEPGVLAEPVDLGEGVLLRRAPPWLKSDQIAIRRDELRKDTKFAFVTEYHAESRGEPDPTWTGKAPRSKQDAALERIRLANLALWIARPSCIGFEMVIAAVQDGREWSLRSYMEIDRLIPHERHVDVRLAKEDFEQAAALHRALARVPRDGSVWAAAKAVMKGLSETWWEGRYLYFWIAMEALFGPDEPHEVTHRLAQRAALLIGSSAVEAKELFKIAKGGYRCRSQVVHGLRLASLKKEESEQVLFDVEELARRALGRILGDQALADTFSGKNRDPFLEDLAFRSK